MSPRKKASLSGNEWKLMSVLWQAEEPLVLSEIMEKLENEVDWSYSTYQTQLARLVESGYLKFKRRGRIRFYSPAAPMEKCIAEESETIHSRIPRMAANQLLLCMMREAQSVTPEEADELSALVEKLRRESQQNKSS